MDSETRPTRTGTIAPQIAELARPLDSLTADPANLRKHDERSVDAIAASLTRFGQQTPIVIDHAGVVIKGNGTLMAARKLGWTHLAAIQSTLDGTERVMYAIADNRSAELSSWDEEGLGRVLGTLTLGDIGDIGFTAQEAADLHHPDEVLRDESSPLAELPEAVTRPGDLWILGEHRLLCGDSTLADNVDRVMREDKAAIIQTDPPYLVDYTGDRPKKDGKSSGKDWTKYYNEISADQAVDFYTKIFSQVARVAAPHAAILSWHSDKRFPELITAWTACGIMHHQNVIWVKPAPVLGRVAYHFRHEPCAVGWVKGSKPAMERLFPYSSVWELDFDGKSRNVGNEHPTQKPLEIFARPLRKHTKFGAICFEPFSGSGSQLIAAEQLGRRCRAIELEPAFVDVAIRRWQSITGQEAVLDGTDTTWAQVAEHRGVKLE